MSLKDLARRLFRKSLRCAPPRGFTNRTRLAVTPLEDRVNPVGTVSVAALTHAVENNTAGVFRFTGSGFSGSQTVSFFYSGTGTATPGTDFDSSQTSVSVGNGTTDLTISTYNDANVEGTEDIVLVIFASKAYNGGGSSATINLYDDDTPQVTVAKQGGDPTEGGNGAFRITRSGSTSGDLTVNFTVGGTATSGTDFTSIGTSAKISSGNSYVDVSVPTLADNVVEAPNETVTITITDGGTSYTALPSATASLTITDDPPVVSIAGTNTDEGANGKFRISRTGGKISDSLTVYYSVTGGNADSGDDFTALSGSVVIGGGNSYADVTVAALADNLIEGDEDLEVTITSGSYTIGTATDTLIITDDPPLVSVARYEDGEEGGSDGTFRVSRSGGDISEALVITYTVGGTAVGLSDVDYVELSGTVTIPSSAAYADITIDVTNDGSTEGTETVTITLDTDEDWLNGSASDTLFIWDNEGTFVYWTGAEDDSWMNADNWSGNAVPDGDDIVIFNGTYVDDVTLSGPLSPYSIGELRVTSGYTGTITLSFPLSVGSLSMKGGTIDQPYSGYGSDLTVTGAALWTGGVLNSTANAATVAFSGSEALIAPLGSGTLSSGSALEFTGEATVRVQSGTVEFTNDVYYSVTTLATLVLDTSIGDIAFVQPSKATATSATTGKLLVVGGGIAKQPSPLVVDGTLTITGRNTVYRCTGGDGLTPSIQTSPGGVIAIENGSFLVAENGCTVSAGGELLTFAHNRGTDQRTTPAILGGNLTWDGGIVTIGGSTPHVWSKFKVVGNVNWTGGSLQSLVDNKAATEKLDQWEVTGTLSVNTTGKSAPTFATGTPDNVAPGGAQVWRKAVSAGVISLTGAMPTDGTTFSVHPQGSDPYWDIQS